MAGVEFRLVDYDRPESLDAAMKGIARVVLVSGSEVGHRVRQHTAVIDAAARAGVQLLAYTSILKGEANPLQLATRTLEKVIGRPTTPMEETLREAQAAR